MESLLQIGCCNALVASALAVPIALLGRRCRRPTLMHALWALVLLTLISPRLIEVPWTFETGSGVERRAGSLL